MSGVFHIGHLQAGAPIGRAVLVVAGGDTGPLRVTATAPGYAFERVVSAAPATTPVRKALSARGVSVFVLELEGPLPASTITLSAERAGIAIAQRLVRPIPAEIGDEGISFVPRIGSLVPMVVAGLR